MKNMELKQMGYTIFRGVLNEEQLIKYRNLADKALQHPKIEGMGLHAIVKVPELVTLLDTFRDTGILKFIEDDYFSSKFIINSFSVLDNNVSQANFSSQVHRDIRFYSRNMPLMLNTLVMLDDFTVENGATWLLPGSHMFAEPPSAVYWDKYALQATGKAGDIIVWNSNLYHKSGENTTGIQRRGIPIVFSKSAMKQLLDYPRALGDKRVFSEENQQLLGYDSIVPASLDEWYSEDRTYKKNQD